MAKCLSIYNLGVVRGLPWCGGVSEGVPVFDPGWPSRLGGCHEVTGDGWSTADWREIAAPGSDRMHSGLWRAFNPIAQMIRAWDLSPQAVSEHACHPV